MYRVRGIGCDGVGGGVMYEWTGVLENRVRVCWRSGWGCLWVQVCVFQSGGMRYGVEEGW